MEFSYREVQAIIEQKSSLQLKRQYWQKWIQYIETVRKQRYNAVKMLEYQHVLEERLLNKIFRAWVQAHEEDKFKQLLRLKNSMREPEEQPQYNDYHEKQYQRLNPTPHKQDDNDNLLYKMQLATRFHHRKTYAKCIAGWISYGIVCNKFQQNLSKVYIKFLLKKYFQIIHEFKCKSIDKKAKKAISLMNSPKKQDLSHNAHSQMNFVTPANLISQIDRFPSTAQNFRQLLHHNPLQKRNQPQQAQSNTVYTGFQRNTAGLGQSRRSEFSTLSAQLEYNSKRKFRPITKLPSIPDLENIEKRLGQNERAAQRHKIKSPIKSYHKQGEQTKSLVSNLSQSNLTQLNQNPQTIKKQKILDLIVKEKLLTLAIMKGDEFVEGLEYENYREKTVNGLRKLRDVRIR